MKDYSDIINLPPHKSRNHIPMDIQKRAVQFAPFAALTGYEEKIREVIFSRTPLRKQDGAEGTPAEEKQEEKKAQKSVP